MKFHTRHGTVEGNSPAGDAFAARFARISAEYEETERGWVANLKAQGIAAAHPQDGWVDRKNNTVHLAYPQFAETEKLKPGARIALGQFNKFRIVEIIRKEEDVFGMIWWRFREL